MNSKKQMKQVGQYIIYLEKKLGEGQYGKVYAASDLKDETKQYAVKVIPSTIFQSNIVNSQMLQKEIEVLKKLKHPNIACLIEISQSTNNLYLFLDYCNGGDLNEYILSKELQRLSESESMEFFQQIVNGYQFLYSQKIIHRDLKPENLMLHNGKIKIGDFGFGRFIEGEMDSEQRMSIKCTPIYASPQLLNKQSYSSKCDIWSTGCILYKMLYGQYPFIARDLPSLISIIKQKVVREEFQFPLEPQISEEVKNVIVRMLKYEEQDRISWDEIFKHPILQKKYNILSTQEILEENDKNNPIFQSIIQNRQHVMDNVVTDYAKNFLKQPNQEMQKYFQKPAPLQEEENKKNTPKNYLTQDKNLFPISSPRPKAETFEEHSEDMQFRQSLQKFQQVDLDNQKITRVDKMILFLRNQALFADVTMQLIFVSRNKFGLPNLLFYEIIYCLTGYYSFNLDLLKMMLQQKVPVRIVKQDDFDIYVKSTQFSKTKQKIEKDAQTANDFFSTLSKGILKEIQKLGQADVQNQDLRDFENFIKNQTANYNEYKLRVQNKIKQFFLYVSPALFKNDINSLKGIRGLQIFFKLDQYMPIQNFYKFDFRQFYDVEMNNLTSDQLYQKILTECIF
ncbi:protein kinase domain protein [Ichthyophthirius multifiliis]|uniref:Protein kinase domain protein n=1 Tax=Ichthyophthirius multifiliis TaxID=5932 RepID=G0QXC1_ICHMU|nr:protein kinase domain protein [Ichthyophthirius multifiliis]EGR30134.1 protein kinase domain protein [Ichthyophthirius multifiliis]|eukprot:XP_004031370.1 protein kinase domain protein [Ichthyophthirius multifiliis]